MGGPALGGKAAGKAMITDLTGVVGHGSDESVNLGHLLTCRIGDITSLHF